MISIILPILLIILWTKYCLLEGIIEAYFYYYAVESQEPIKELHPFFFAKRTIVLGIIFYALDHSITLKSSIFLLSCILSFSFLHDGIYYLIRNQLSGIYPQEWFSNSTTSTAIFEFNSNTRIVLFILGIIGYITFFII